jgi:hypothetical protein
VGGADGGQAVEFPSTIEVPLWIQRIQGPIELDGRIDEPAWDQLARLPMTMFSPFFGGEMTEETDIRIGHDDAYLYVGARMYDSDPSGIRTNTFVRDVYSGDDIISIVIDSYNDYETAVWFTTNPSGARSDRTVSNDGQFSGGGMPMNADWNSFWDVSTTQTDEGWFAEFRIPFSTLGFQSIDGETEMGMIIYRFIPRKNERQLYPAIDPAVGGLAFAKPSVSQRIRIEDVEPSKPVYVTPYVLGGFDEAPALNTSPDGSAIGWGVERDPTSEIGGDLRYSPTSNLSVDLTVNTDFAQVEADDQQINLTRFALFQPEKRQFFQERASTFEFNTGGFFNRVFYSRRIGLHAGEVVRIYGGARAVGRAQGTDFGFLSMQTASHGGRSSENMSVLRLNQQVLNPFSRVGGIVTSRLGDNGQDNLVYGLDTVLRLVGNEYFVARWVQSFDEAISELNAWSSGLALVQWERRQDEGLSYRADFTRVGHQYTPRLGFQNRRDFTYGGLQAQYKWFLDEASSLRSWAIGGNTGHYFSNPTTNPEPGPEDSTGYLPESRVYAPEINFEWKGGTELRIGYNRIFESVADSFRVSEAYIVPGDYWFDEVSVRFQLPRARTFRGDFTVTGGTFYDGTRIGTALNPTWNASKYLELGAGYEVNRLEFEDRGESTTAHLTRVKVAFALNTHLSFSGFAQYNSVDDITSINARFRYHFREGTDLWIVYNEGLNMERYNGLDPRLPISAGRQLLIKYNHALIF